MSRRKFVKGAVILSAASLLCKALSAVFKIPLDRIFIGPEGIAIYQNANTIYNWILAIAATGIPLAVSNMVADSDDDTAAEIRSSAMWSVTAAGIATGVFLFAFAPSIASRIAGGGYGPATYAIRTMAPAAAFLGIVSAYKGYFQGVGNMLPSALSQIADSLCKAVMGLLICSMLMPKGIEIATAGAMCGVTFGTALGGVVLLVMGKKYIKVYKKPKLGTVKKIIVLSIPVTLGAAGFSCMMMADNFTVQSILVGLGNTVEESTAMFGHLTRAFMIYNLPATLISAITVSVAPACAEDMKNGSRELLREHSCSAMKMLSLVSVPCMVGAICFSKEILSLLYVKTAYNELLMFTGILMVLIPFTQVISGILQATGCVWKPIIVLGVTVLIKIGLNFVLIPGMGIIGAPFATVAAYAVGCGAFVYLFGTHMGFGIPIGIFLRPLAAALAGAAVGRMVFSLLRQTAWAFLAGAAVMAVIYAVLAIVLRAVTLDDLKR